MLRQASYGTIKIGTYQSFKRLLVDRPEGESQFLFALIHTLCSHILAVTAPIDMCTFLFKDKGGADVFVTYLNVSPHVVIL